MIWYQREYKSRKVWSMEEENYWREYFSDPPPHPTPNLNCIINQRKSYQQRGRNERDRMWEWEPFETSEIPAMKELNIGIPL